MIKTETLEKLCLELSEYPPNWEEIIARFKAHPNFDPERELDLGGYTGILSEIHMDLSLEKIAVAHPDLGVKFDHDLRDGSKSENYIFNYSLAGRLFANSTRRRKSDGKPFAPKEYDKVLLVGEMPVVFEIKIRRWQGNSKKYLNYKDELVPKRDMGIQGSFTPKRVRYLLYPIQKFFKSDVGYVLVIPRDLYYNRLNAEENSVYRQFQENNGLVVPFYTDRHTFRRELTQVVQDHGLKVKPQ